MGDYQEEQQGQLPPEPCNTEQARAILDQIRFDRGIYDDNDRAELARTSENWQRKVTESGKKLRKELGAAVRAVSIQLYTSRFRFIYELIQNADDALYSKSAQSGQVPHLKFTIRPNEIVVESNENGFSVANVLAISAIAQSSKQDDSATTGEKGLGFKSVFAVSDLVRVQSGLWSFEFRYPPKDSGLGMIAPYWMDLAPLERNVGSRITLRLANTGDAFRQELTQAFEDVPETTLLFLRKLQKLTISFAGEGSQESVRTFQRHDVSNTVDRTISVDSNGVRKEFLYKMRSKTVSVPAKDQLDESDEADEETTVVELAFPVDKSTKLPCVSDEGQHVFTFLPLKRMAGLPFIIQADFATSANREAVTDIPRNRGLRCAVNLLFADSVEGFCRESPELRFSWTRFLPDHLVDDFWKSLCPGLKNALSEKALLVSRKGTKQNRISELQVVPAVFRHQGEPLLHSDSYISEQYDANALAALQTLGLQTLSKQAALDVIESDLTAGSSLFAKSAIMSTELSDSWHTTFVEFLALVIRTNKKFRSRLAQLPILPVSTQQGVRWKSPAEVCKTERVYLPRIMDDENAPALDPDFGLLTLHPDACAEHARREFYTSWEIGHAETQLVCDAVVKRNTNMGPGSINLYVQHFAILFWQGFGAAIKARPLQAVDTRATIMRSDHLYFASSMEYSTSQLLSSIKHPSFGFLHQRYLKNDHALQRHVNSNCQKWREWIADVAGVRDYPELKSTGFDGLSPLFLEIICKAPSKVVWTLKAHWRSYETELAAYPSIVEELKNAKVQCRTGRLHRLCDTVLPTDALLSASKSFGVEEKMPFLDISSASLASNDWSFLKTFDVCSELTLKLHIDALEHLAKLPPSEEGIEAHTSAVYESIGAFATFEHKMLLQDFFATNSTILACGRWSASKGCVWKTPTCPIAKASLEPTYAALPRAENLFKTLLEIGNATYEDVLLAIEAKKTSVVSISTMALMYKELDALVDWGTIKKDIRTKFERQALIFDGRGWTKLSSCVWNSAVDMRGRAVLQNLYSEELQGFFKERLGVKSLNLTMILEELIRVVSGGSPDAEEVKSMLREISSMLSAESFTDEVESLIKKLRLVKFLPMSVDQPTRGSPFCTAEDTFLVVDDRRFGDAFRGKIKLLDFSINDFTSLQPLFAALRLQNRYLSRHVQIDTSVEDWTTDERLTNEMRTRSYAISCCIMSYKPYHAQDDYIKHHQNLLQSTVCTSAKMCTKFRLEQDQKLVEVESETNYLKISQEDGNLKFIVPRIITECQRCYRTYLPKQLLSFLEVTAQPAEKQMYRILNDNISALREVLAEEGIPDVPDLEVVDYPETNEENLTHDGSVVVETVSAQSHLGSQSVNPVRIDVSRQTPSSDPIEPGAEHHQQDPYSPAQFRRVLEHVVRRASEGGGVAFDLGPLRNALDPTQPTPNDLGMIPGQKIHPNVFSRIGAAGELFVFERLQAHGLNDLTFSNWQSKIRHLTRSLPKYQDILPYGAPEEGYDIMYEDRDKKLEMLLRDKGYNAFSTWTQQGEEPIKFYIEVKTTINSCNEPFFMGENQYRKLSENALMTGQRPRVIYVVARVFDLLSPDVGVQYFVDPKSLEGTTLQFEWGRCIVTPRT